MAALFAVQLGLYDYELMALLADCRHSGHVDRKPARAASMRSPVELDAVRRDSLKNLDLDRLTGLQNQAALERRLESGEPFTRSSGSLRHGQFQKHQRPVRASGGG